MFKQRLVVSAAGIPLVFWLAVLGGWPFFILSVAVVILGLEEALKLVGIASKTERIFAQVMALGVLLAVMYGLAELAEGFMALTFMGLFLINLALKSKIDVVQAALYFTSWFLVVWFGSFFLRVRLEQGLAWTLFCLVLAWSFDISAYLAGSRWGKIKLCRQVSPGKTVEGTVAAFLAATAVGYAAASWLDLSAGISVMLGAILGGAALLGDLAESGLKRYAGIKDSGRMLPGHGGILDRIDSLLFVFPVAYYVAMALGGR